MPGWVHAYWSWAGSNIGAMPAEFVITAIATLVFQKQIKGLLAWLRSENRAALAEAREDAKAAREIAADLYHHVTGEHHPVHGREAPRAD